MSNTHYSIINEKICVHYESTNRLIRAYEKAPAPRGYRQIRKGDDMPGRRGRS